MACENEQLAVLRQTGEQREPTVLAGRIPVHQRLVEEERQPLALLVQVVHGGQAKREVHLLASRGRERERDFDRVHALGSAQHERTLAGTVRDQHALVAAAGDGGQVFASSTNQRWLVLLAETAVGLADQSREHVAPITLAFETAHLLVEHLDLAVHAVERLACRERVDLAVEGGCVGDQILDVLVQLLDEHASACQGVVVHDPFLSVRLGGTNPFPQLVQIGVRGLQIAAQPRGTGRGLGTRTEDAEPHHGIPVCEL